MALELSTSETTTTSAYSATPNLSEVCVRRMAQLGYVLFWLVPLALVATLYAPTAVELWRVWEVDPNYGHGSMVVVCSILLAAWTARRRAGSRTSLSRPVGGLVRCLIGFALHIGALFIGNLLLDVVGLVYLLLGVLLVLGGPEARRAYSFPVLFLLFAAPLPIAWYQPVAILLQQVVGVVSGHLLNLAGIATYREGNMLHLADLSLEVGEACSGIRQLTAVVALAAAMGFLSGRERWFRGTLLVVSVPIAVASNCLRIMLTGVLAQTLGRKWAEGFFHEAEGMVLVLFSALFLYALANLLGGRAAGREAGTVS